MTTLHRLASKLTPDQPGESPLVATRLTPETLERLKAICRRNEIPPSAFIRQATENALASPTATVRQVQAAKRNARRIA